MKNFKLCRQMLACVLVFAMVLGTCATAFAVVPGSGAAKPIKYVSLGDSMTNGYGLEGYDGNSGVEDYGNNSYANLFAQRIHAADHKQLAMSAMRAEDLHWLLELDYVNAPHLWEEDWNEDAWNNAFSTGDYWTWDEICTHSRTDATIAAIDAVAEYEVDGIDDVARYYQEAVKEADIISLGMGNGNFGVFAFGRIMEAIGFGGTPDEAMIYNVERAIAECDPEMQAKILGLKDTLVAKVAPLRATVGAAFSDAQWEALFNTVVYTGLSYVLNYAGSVEAILQLNPDAEIILVALMNTFAEPGTVVDYTNISTIGDIMGAIFEPLNMFIAGLPTVMQAAGNGVYKDAKFYYAEAPEVDCLVNTYEDGIDGTIRDRFVESIVGECEHNTHHSSPDVCNDAGMVWGLLAPMVPGLVDGAELKWITLADIAAYEAMTDVQKAGYAAGGYKNEAISCALYLAFEGAIINAADATVDLASVMNLGDLSPAIFGGVMAEFNANIGAAGDAYRATVIDFVEPLVTDGINGALGGAATIDADTVKALLAETVTAEDVVAGMGIPEENPAFAAYVSGLSAGVEEGQANVDALCMLLALPETLSAALANDTNINGLLGLFARCIIGNGIGAHPSAVGHEALADAIYKAYEEGYTAKDETINNVITIITEYYDEAYAYAYAAAEKEGYVDAAAAAIDKAIAAVEDVKARDFEDDEMTADFEALLDAELDAVVATLNEVKAVLESDAAADVEGLETSVAELWDDLLVHLSGAGALLDQAGVDVETLVIPAVDAYVSTVIAKVNDALAEVDAYIKGINAEVEALIAEVEAEIAAVKEKIAEIKASVEEIKAELPAEVVEAIDKYIAELEELVDDYVSEIIAELTGVEIDPEKIAEILEQLKDISAEDIKEYIDGVKAEIEAAIEEAKAEIEAAIEEIKAEIEAAIEEAKAELEAAIAEFEAEVKAQVEAVLAEVDAKVSEILAEVDAKVSEVVAEVEAKIDELKAEAAKLIAMAGHKHYEAAEGSKYVSIGGSTVAGTALAYPSVPYYALIGDHYDIDSQAVAAAGLAPEAALALVEANSAAIEVADLVTYQLDASFFVTALLGGEADWDKYIDAETKALVDEVLAQTKEVLETNWAEYAGAKLEEIIPEIKAAVIASLPEEVDFAEEVFDAAADFVVPYLIDAAAFVEGKKVEANAEAAEAIEAIDQAAIDYAEKVAYAVVSYAIETKAVVEKIQEINPGATLVVAGMYNPVRGLELVVGEETIDAEEIFEYVIDATNLYYAALAVENKGFAFADVSEAETNGFNVSLNVTGMEMDEIIANVAGLAMGGLDKVMHANAAGHEYIKEQIVKALTCDYSHGVYESLDDETHAIKCSICGYAKTGEHDLDCESLDGTHHVITCSVCDYAKTVEHTLSYEKLDKTYHTVECSICGYDATEAHDFDNKTCTLCGYVKSNGGFGGGGGGAVSTGKFVVKFDTNGGSTIASVTVKKDELLAEPTAPTKDGYVFDGWYTDKALTAKYDFSTPVTKSFTLYAKWVKASAADKFVDLDKTAWYYEYVKAIIEKGLMNGISETQFAPDATLTRGMFVTILHRVEGEVAAENAVAFADVAEGQWYTNAVKWASANGIVNGISETEFAPDTEVTREQMAAMIARYADYKKIEASVEGDVTYTDSDEISEYAKDAVKTANKLGILIGNADGSFAPKKNATRAEAAALFVRLLGVLEQ